MEWKHKSCWLCLCFVSLLLIFVAVRFLHDWHLFLLYSEQTIVIISLISSVFLVLFWKGLLVSITLLCPLYVCQGASLLRPLVFAVQMCLLFSCCLFSFSSAHWERMTLLSQPSLWQAHLVWHYEALWSEAAALFQVARAAECQATTPLLRVAFLLL